MRTCIAVSVCLCTEGEHGSKCSDTASFVASLCLHSTQEMLTFGLRVLDLLMTKVCVCV